MSNPAVGLVYQQIIRDVIETSRVDFEEGGVEESVLDELAQGWQKKLSAHNVAQFPWDPKQETAAPMMNPPVNTNYQQSGTPSMAQPQSTSSIPSLPLMQPMNDNMNVPRIKPEPGLENGMQPSPQMPFNSISGMTAQQRAAQNLQATYGSRAAASINAIQGGMPQQVLQSQQQNMQTQPQQPPLPSNQQSNKNYMASMSQAQYQQAMARQMAAQSSAHSQQSGVNGAQTDGADDMEESLGVMKRVNTDGEVFEMGRVEIDNIIREKIEAMGRSMEGGGLMLPLKERYPSGRQKKRKTAAPLHRLIAAQKSSSAPQFDGGDDEDDEDDKSGILKDEDDEDAINSDLDDPDDGLNDEEDDDEGMGHIMLCMYDKVQRVKNKWKCVMKDGVLTVNGKEYVFHKASGEYEW